VRKFVFHFKFSCPFGRATPRSVSVGVSDRAIGRCAARHTRITTQNGPLPKSNPATAYFKPSCRSSGWGWDETIKTAYSSR
jgi:hypothetical protein